MWAHEGETRVYHRFRFRVYKKRKVTEQILSWVFTRLILRGSCYILMETAMVLAGFDPAGQLVFGILCTDT